MGKTDNLFVVLIAFKLCVYVHTCVMVGGKYVVLFFCSAFLVQSSQHLQSIL